ncbi:hypothetical protein N7532_000791 [Penicillium argentinense]|uniref:Uncharacterized protein n=1 Tax=Penicillium argentinense TaxID=1131581 RepID=A0A9W9G656_9EURO|nr:uncharacterized protein N7532_000791 [Penicillium argentinense]KAJ5112746.1 hypothetical protein N7532_000791 [Penicillium argentinense]
MIGNGNRIAEVRRDEFIHLERTSYEGRIPGTRALNIMLSKWAAWNDYHQAIQERDKPPEQTEFPGPMALPTPGYPHSSEATDMQVPSVEFLDSIGISSTEFFCIVDQISNPGVPYSILDYGSQNKVGS